MATHSQHPHHSGPQYGPGDVFSLSRGRLTTALILIALGLVFLLGQSGRLDYGSSWWVLFIAIPGFVMAGGAVKDYIDHGEFTSGIVWEGIGGIVALVLSAIFIWDPTWSFTRGWTLDVTFPFLRDMDRVWPWLLVALGVFLIYRAWATRSLTPALFGIAVAVVGGVFILNISWDVVWPLAIVAAGVGLLLVRNDRAG